jgi:predicted nucleic acid binding AN1-type Zn finger protein
MVQCNKDECKKRAIFHMSCQLCNKQHCNTHRLPEEHECINLEISNNLCKSKQAQKLIDGKVECEKLVDKV